MIVVKLSGVVQKLVHMTVVLWLPSKVIGAIVAALTGYIVTFAILLVLLIPLKNSSLFAESSIANYIIYESPVLSSSAEGISSSINEVYQLGEDVSHKRISVNEANLETMDILLKYDIVSPEVARDLVRLDKLDDISGIDKVIRRYE